MKIKLYTIILGLLILAQGLGAQSIRNSQYLTIFQEGSRSYGEMRMFEAAAQFRNAQEIAKNANDWAQATYWVILTELAMGDYGSAIRDMDELDRVAPKSNFARDMAYHRARAYYNQGYFEDALISFKRYNDSVSTGDNEAADRKAAAFFWMGECLYSMGQFGEAEKFYSWVIAKYPNSPKVEVSGYRVDLIKQKKIEAELLSLLRWSHEESLRNSEENQRKIRTYENALNAYQRKIAELTQGASGARTDELPGAASASGLPAPSGVTSSSGISSPTSLPPQTGIPESSGVIDNKPEDDEALRRRAIQLEEEVKQILEQYEQKSGGDK
jgi:tetratricopeptide (TPR) repeat protein